MAEKIGLYICAGCDIGKSLDVAALGETIKNKFGALIPVVKTHPILCSADGVKSIKDDVAAGTIDAACLCACSGRVKWDVFQFEDILVDRVNLREQAVWSYTDVPGYDASADLLKKMAQDYCKMGVLKLRESKKPAPEIPEMSKTILVLGGGYTGLTSALGAAKAGYDVVLIEKAKELGGFAAKMKAKVPASYPFESMEDVGVTAKIEAVKANSKIKVLTGSTLTKLAGAPGTFTATIATPSGEVEEKIGSVVAATGWKPFDASKLVGLGYGAVKNVITNVEYETMFGNGGLKRPSDGAAPKSVAFIQCAGQRSTDEGMLPYCSSVCCMTTLKHAKYLREADPEATAMVFYKDMIVPGVHERYYKASADDPGIMLTKGAVQSVTEGPGGGVTLTVGDTLLGEAIELTADLVVLATGMVPSTVDEPVLNFEYRQGPAFPNLELFDGFGDSNYICFPYETRRTGVFNAGAVRQPMLLSQAEDDACGAALKAIQCVTSINRGMAVHPRSGDMTYPVFNFTRCTQCKRCTEECPFGALDDDEKGTPQPNPTRCRRCGTCMGACPERVISFDNYSVGQIGGMIKEVEVPDNMSVGGPRVIVLACENDAYPALDMAAFRGSKISPFVRFVPVRCLGSVNTIWIADSLSKGVDGVILMGCKYGDDYQCHFMKGSELCKRRMDNIGETMEKLGIEAERVEQMQLSIDEYDKAPGMIEDFMKKIFRLGPNPYKGY